MKNQVLSIEQMRHLQKLGVDTSKASMIWGGTKDWQELYTPRLFEFDEDANYIIEAFTLQDMLEMMPSRFSSIPFEDKEQYVIHYMVMEKLTGKWFIGYTYGLIKGKWIIKFQGDLLTCAYEALCWLAKNGCLKGGEK